MSETSSESRSPTARRQGLYDPRYEHDACGLGFVAHIKGRKSHAIIAQALQVLKNLTHRGATGADPLQGDGAGILIQLPDAFLRRVCGRQGLTLPAFGQYGVGMVFLPKEPASRMACEQEIERAIASEGQQLLGWRDVPTDNSGLSERTKEVEPVIRQVFIARGANAMDPDALERKLYIIRKKSGHAIQALRLRHGKEFYVPSMSTRTIVYKGMLLAHQVGEYYRDLKEESMVSALAMVHQRFSTNTFPTWDLAHPFRLVCHNGEINTLRGNVNWIRARQQAIASSVLGADLDKVWPLIYDGQSDSASFDNALELLLMGGLPAGARDDADDSGGVGRQSADGRGPARVLRIPRRADGALGRAGGDGVHRRPADRRHPRPQRAAAGALHRHRRRLRDHGLGGGRARHPRAQGHPQVAPAAGQDVAGRHRAGPHHRRRGTQAHAGDRQAVSRVDRSLPRRAATRCPIRRRPSSRPCRCSTGSRPSATARKTSSSCSRRWRSNGEEASARWATTPPCPCCRTGRRSLYNYFKQLFAQVTNPPIDPIREELVMSLVTFIGPRPNLLAVDTGADGADPPMRLEAEKPILTAEGMEKIRHIALFTGEAFRSLRARYLLPGAPGAPPAWKRALASLCAHAEDATRLGYNILIVSDRRVVGGAVADPGAAGDCGGPSAPGAQGTAHQHRAGRGNRLGARGAPVRLARRLRRRGDSPLPGAGVAGATARVPARRGARGSGEANYIKAIGKGLYKVMSKMGISTYQSYCGAQIFEAVGLSSAFVDKYFTGTASNIEGIGLFEVAEEAFRLHQLAFGDDPVLRDALDAGGEYHYRVRGEEHMWTPDAIAKLQHAARSNSYRDLQRIRAADQRPGQAP